MVATNNVVDGELVVVAVRTPILEDGNAGALVLTKPGAIGDDYYDSK